jgi:integrase
MGQILRELAAGTSYSNADDAIFTDELGRRVTPMAASCAFARFARKASISTTRLHDVRHTTGTWLLAEGVDYATVARILGHATPAVTLNVYAHALPTAESEAVALLDRRLAALGGQP